MNGEMSDGMERARRLAAEAQERYGALKADAEASVVRWQWATFAIHSYKPADFEISKMKKGRPLPAEPSPPKSGAHGYGFDDEGRVVVERQQTEFPGRCYETFLVHEPDGIASFHYSYDPKKRWINAEWLATGAPGVVACHSVYERGNAISVEYEYDDGGRMVRCRRRGTNQPYGDLDDAHELEYDGTGQIVRVYWCQPDGQRLLDFERPAKEATLRACRRRLLTDLTEATIQALRTLQPADEIYALVFSHCGADYQHRLPPQVSVGLVAEGRRLQALHGASAREYLWNPAEWSAGELALKLTPALATLCASVNQDIWQNELSDDADRLLLALARSVAKAALPCRRADGFVAVVVALDAAEDCAEQVAAQVSGKVARALRAGGML
jgi:hypothetical protein